MSFARIASSSRRALQPGAEDPEGGREDGGWLNTRRLRDEEMASGPRHVGRNPAVRRRDGEERRSAEHRVRAALVAARVARDDGGAVLLTFSIDAPQHR